MALNPPLSQLWIPPSVNGAIGGISGVALHPASKPLQQAGPALASNMNASVCSRLPNCTHHMLRGNLHFHCYPCPVYTGRGSPKAATPLPPSRTVPIRSNPPSPTRTCLIWQREQGKSSRACLTTSSSCVPRTVVDACGWLPSRTTVRRVPSCCTWDVGGSDECWWRVACVKLLRGPSSC